MQYIRKNGPSVSNASVKNLYANGYGSIVDYGTVKLDTVYRYGWVSTKTPNFTKIKKRDLPMNGFNAYGVVNTASRCDVTQPFGSNPVRYRRWTGSTRDFFPTMTNIIDANWSTANSVPTMARAEQAALSKCSNMKMNVAQSFAERKQTASLLVDSVNRLAVFAVALKKGNLRKAREVLNGRPKLFAATYPTSRQAFRLFEGKVHTRLGKSGRRYTVTGPQGLTRDIDFGSLWLEFRYGWSPLVYDIYGAAELCAQLATKSRPLFVKGRASNNKETTSTLTAYSLTARAVRREAISAQCVLAFDLDDAAVDSLKSTGISNPLLVAWELVPYSFVADWIYPVGTYLETLQATNGLKFIKGATSAKNIVDSVSTYVSNTAGYTKVSLPPCEQKAVFIDRNKLSAFPSVELPKFDLNVNWKRSLDALSLLKNVFTRK